MDESSLNQLAIAEHYLSIEQPEKALEVTSRVSGDALGEPEFWLIRGGALCELKQYEEAVYSIKRGLSIDPDNVTLLHTL